MLSLKTVVAVDELLDVEAVDEEDTVAEEHEEVDDDVAVDEVG